MKKSLNQIHEDVPPFHYDKGIKNNPLQRSWHFRRINQLKNIIPKSPGKVLDIGCHSGLLTSQVLKHAHSESIDGIDISKRSINLAKKRITSGKFKVGNAHNLPYKNRSFDTVLCIEVLEHVENPDKVVSEIKRVLKAGGMAIILVPTDNFLFKFIWAIWNEIYPVWKHSHVQSFRGNELQLLLKKNDFKVISQKKFNLGMLLLIRVQKS